MRLRHNVPIMKLADYMLANQIGPSALAETVGVNHATIIRYRDGRRIPRPETMARIMAATGGQVGPADFYPAPARDEVAR